ncbi:MAG: response regulator transcription factor [Pseudarthrobacter sp.]|nr:response regulator transcription factor [Pseudarthrobacter sp.]
MDTPAAPAGKAGPADRPIRIFILNDHDLVRQGLRDLLEHDGFEIAGGSGSASEAGRLIPLLRPDLAVLDDRLPDGTGIEVCRELHSTAPDVKCLILTGWDEQQAARAAVLAGASGYVLKQVGPDNELVNAIRTAATGTPLARPGLREWVAEGLHAAASASWPKTLSGRERNVLALMARGLTNPQIAQELTLPGETVAACVSSVLHALGFRRRGQVATAPAASD